MKTIWDILQIAPTTDATAIRKAYALRLKETNPEIDPEGFQQLRAAYENAIKPEPTYRLPPLQQSEKKPLSIPKALPVDLIPVQPKAELQVSRMIEEISSSPDPNLLRRWKKEGAFYHLGISHQFQEELLELFSSTELKSLFLVAYTLFDWNILRQKLSHPFAQKLESIIGNYDLELIEYLLNHTPASKMIAAVERAIKIHQFDIARLLLTQIEPTDASMISILYELHRHGFSSYFDDTLLLQDLSPLHSAIQCHDHPTFDRLIQSHVDINQVQGPSYFSPLFVAVKVQNKYAYRTLMDLGALDLPTGAHHTALFAAVCNNDISTVEELLERGSDRYQYAAQINRTLVYAAARYGHHEILRILLDEGLHPDDVGGHPWERYFIRIPQQPEVPGTPLCAAVDNLDIEMVEILLDAGADPNRKWYGIPPLHRAITKFDEDTAIERSHAIIDLLLERGADIHLKSDDGYTLLAKAKEFGPLETAQLLKKKIKL